MLIGCSVTSRSTDRLVENLRFVAGIRRCADEVHLLVVCPFTQVDDLREKFTILRHSFKSFDIIPCQDKATNNRKWQHLFHHALLRSGQLPKSLVILPEDCIPVKSNWVEMLQVAAGPQPRGLSSTEVGTDCIVFPTGFYGENDAINYVGQRIQPLHQYLATTLEHGFLHPPCISDQNRDTTAILVGDEQCAQFMLEYGPESLPQGTVIDPDAKVEPPTPEPHDILTREESIELARDYASIPAEAYLVELDAREEANNRQWVVPVTEAEMPLVDERFGDLVVDDETERAFGTREERELVGGYPEMPDDESPSLTPMRVVQYGSSAESPNPQHRWYVIEMYDPDADTRAQPKSREELLCTHVTVQAAVAGYIRYAGVKASAYDRETGMTVSTVGFRTGNDTTKKQPRKLDFKTLLHMPLHKMTWNELTMGLYRPLVKYFNQKWHMVSREELEPIVDKLRRDYIKLAVEARADVALDVVR